MIFLFEPNTGKINQTMDFASSERMEDLRKQGFGVIEFGNDPMQNYVDLANPKDPVLRTRPILSQTATKSEVGFMEETVIPAMPACSLEVVGPVSGTVAHPGGDLKLQFALPGSYTVRCEAFPFRYAQWTIVVHPNRKAATTAATKEAFTA